MRKIVYTLLLAGIIISCKSKSSTDKATKDTTAATVSADTTNKTGTLNKTLVFERYEEGDYPHLVFTDPATKESYDFGHPTENILLGTELVIADSTTSFGFRQNPKAVGSSYNVAMEKRMVDGYDGNGQPKKMEGWRITRITQ